MIITNFIKNQKEVFDVIEGVILIVLIGYFWFTWSDLSRIEKKLDKLLKKSKRGL